MLFATNKGTNDDNPQTLYNRGTVGGRVAGNGRSFGQSAPFQRIQIDMEYEIHNLEQIAYGAVLRAFIAQSDAMTWEKEGFVIELRKELRVSVDEHRELLSQVSGDDLIRRIREGRVAGGNRNVAPNVPQRVSNHLPSPMVSASRKRQKKSLLRNPFSPPSQSLLSQPVVGSALPLTSAVKRRPASRIGGRRTHAVPASYHKYGDRVSSGSRIEDLYESIHKSLIGRRVMIRWPAYSNFYEAVISEYNPVDGRHSLVYDSNTPNATVEWVTIKEVPPEDIRWVGISRQGEAGGSKSGVVKDDSEEIEILHTDTLIKKKVGKVLEASHADAFQSSIQIALELLQIN